MRLFFFCMSSHHDRSRLAANVDSAAISCHVQRCLGSAVIMTWQRLHRHDSDIYIISRPSHLGGTVVGMTRHRHHVATKSPQQCCHQHDSVTPSPAWLDIYITSRPNRLNGTIAGMTRHLHRVVAKSPRQRCRQHDSAAHSPAWLCIYIAPWSSHLSSAITSMTQRLGAYFPDPHSNSEVQPQGLEEYHSNR
jgi:hypothetical protein